jgi:hypothetical protein
VKVVESGMDRVRFAVPRRARGWVAGVLSAGVLAMGAAVALAALDLYRVPAPVVVAVPTPEHAEPPGLAEAYLARRAHHLSRLLPVAFPPASAPPDPLPPAWAALAEGPDATLVAEILGDATRDDAGWGPRDPIVGAGLRRLTHTVPDDDEVRAAMGGWTPRLLPLPDRTGQTLEALIEARVVSTDGDVRALLDAPEADHVVAAAVADVRRYDILRAAAVQAAAEREEAATAEAWARVDAGRAARVAVLVRWTAVELGLALLAVCAAGAGAAWLRARPVAVTLDAHGLTVGAHRLAWDELDDVTWREDRVVWTTARREGRVRGLSLGPGEVAALQRGTTTLRTARFATGEPAGRAALGALLERAGR